MIYIGTFVTITWFVKMCRSTKETMRKGKVLKYRKHSKFKWKGETYRKSEEASRWKAKLTKRAHGNVSIVTEIFFNQKRITICEHSEDGAMWKLSGLSEEKQWPFIFLELKYLWKLTKIQNAKIKKKTGNKTVAYISQRNHTSQLDFCKDYINKNTILLLI